MIGRRSNIGSVSRHFGTLALFLFIGTGEAHAQMSSSNCMAMGGGMVHCDTMSMGNAGGPASSGGDDGSTAMVLQGLGDLLGFNGEKSIRKRVGKLIADGDCEGAARYALQKGRIELANQVAQICRPTIATVAPAIDPNNLQSELRRVAANARTPMTLNEGITISRIDATGEQLLLTAIVDVQGIVISDSFRRAATADVCAYKSSIPLLRAGATIRIVYLGRSGREIGSVTTTRHECGL